MFGNCILTATGSSLPVGDDAADNVAEWTCPIDAAANGTRSKDENCSSHDGPNEEVITC